MAGQWYCRIGEHEVGPLNSQQVRELAAKSELLPQHCVRPAASSTWVAASQVQKLFTTEQLASAAKGVSQPKPSTGRTWLVRSGEMIQGPFRTAELRAMAASGQLQRESELCESGTDAWNAAHRYEGLFAPASSSAASEQSPPAPRSDRDGAAQHTHGDGLIRLRCPHCRLKLQAKATTVGRTVNCPSCQQPLIVPNETPSTPVPHAPADSSAPSQLANRLHGALRAVTGQQPVEIQSATSGQRVGEVLPLVAAKQAWQWIKGTIQEIQAAKELRPARGQNEFYGVGRQVDLGFGPLDGPMVYATRDRYAACLDASLIELPLAVRAPLGRQVPRLPYWPTYHDATPEQRGVFLKWLYDGRRDPHAELGYVFIYFYGLERRVLVDKLDHLPIINELLRLLAIYGHSRSLVNYSINLLWLTIALAAESGVLSTDLLCQSLTATSRWTPETSAYFLAACEHIDRTALPTELIARLALPTDAGPTSVVARRHPGKLNALFAARFAERFPDGIELQRTARALFLNYQPASGSLIRNHNSLAWLKERRWPHIQIARKQANAIARIWNECVEELRDFDRAAKVAANASLTAAMYEALPTELQTGEHPEFDAWQKLMQECTNEAGWSVVTAGILGEIKRVSPRITLTKRQCESLLNTADALGLSLEPDARRTGKNYRWDQKLILFHAASGQVGEIEWHGYESAAKLVTLGMQVAHADEDAGEQELQKITRHLERHFSLPESLQKRLEAHLHLCLQGAVDDKSVARLLKQKLSVSQRQVIGEFLVEVALADEGVSDAEIRLLRKLYRQLGLSEDDLESLLSVRKTAPIRSERADRIGISVEIDDDDDDVTGAVVAMPATAAPPRLDLERLRKTREDTHRVQEILTAALGGSDGLALAVKIPAPPPTTSRGTTPQPLADTFATPEPCTQTPALAAPQMDSRFDGLAPQFHTLVGEICLRAEWPTAELRDLARGHGLMLAAALEAINEWSTERWGDWLVEEHETVAQINQALLGTS